MNRATHCPGLEGDRRLHVDPNNIGLCARCGTLLELRAGGIYESLGPALGSKLGDPRRVECLSVEAEAGHYRVRNLTPRAPADVLLFGAEHLWRPA